MMVTIHPEYIVDEKLNRKSVILSWEVWEHILKDLEELDDIRAYDKAKSEPQTSIPFEKAVSVQFELDDNHLGKFLRKSGLYEVNNEETYSFPSFRAGVLI